MSLFALTTRTPTQKEREEMRRRKREVVKCRDEKFEFSAVDQDGIKFHRLSAAELSLFSSPPLPHLTCSLLKFKCEQIFLFISLKCFSNQRRRRIRINSQTIKQQHYHSTNFLLNSCPAAPLLLLKLAHRARSPAPHTPWKRQASRKRRRYIELWEMENNKFIVRIGERGESVRVWKGKVETIFIHTI